MFFLSDNIEITVNGFEVTTDGAYVYRVYIGNTLIFVGNTFLKSGDTSKVFYLNEILNNYQFKGNVKDGYNSGVIEIVRVVLYVEDLTYSKHEEIAFLNQYPNFNSAINTPTANGTSSWMPLLQGADYNDIAKELPLVPTYPFVYSVVLPFNYLGSYGVSEYYQKLLAYNSNTGQYTTSDYEFIIGEDINDGVYGLGNYYMSDILSSNMLLGITNKNMKYVSGDNFNNITFDYVLNQWVCKSTTFTSLLFRISCRLSGGNAQAKLSSYAYNGTNSFTIPFNDVYSNDGYTTLTISAFDEAGKLDRYPKYQLTFDVTNLFNNEMGYNVPLTFECSFINNVLTIKNGVFEIDIEEARPNELVIDTDGEYTTIAKFDYCSRYFLRWMDRYGMTQIQPFDKLTTYSENFVYHETINYKNERKNSSIDVQPKWKLNTKWLNKDVYPFYESIFVSPYLQLYDAVEDKLYNVLVTNTEYIEKTFKNQNKQLFNLQLEVKLNKEQNILY